MVSQPGAIRQAAAIPVRSGQVCLITSSSGKRWVVPKGCMEPGKTAGELALQEAWEEAGLVGQLRPEPVGSYLYEKFGNNYYVVVFLLLVKEAADDWPERTLRKRAWLSPAQALSRIEDEGLRELIRGALEERAEVEAP
ncbi:MAG TPA: NUDIX hydrolase [Gemmataceae bacterium]|nr:NUDIX hydrolase [Gemmataceae bacterium]